MDPLYPQVNVYLQELCRHDDPVLREMEERAAREDFPIIGPVAGRLCYQVARMVGARRVFELGSGYGYSTLWFARAVADNGGGEVYHTVWDEGLSQDARRYLDRAGVASLVRFEVAEAVGALQRAGGTFDLILNDIEKKGYPSSLPVIKEKLRPGGALIVDNCLWHGRIFDPADRAEATEGVRTLTQRLFADPDFVPFLVPVRDGLLVAWRRP